jgi:hypothetical protein
MSIRNGCVALAAVLASACYTGSANTVAGAAVMTGLAAGGAMAERASGGCIATCTNGTVCNPKTGLCEVLPCRGRCGAGEHCEQTYDGERCVPGGGAAEVATPAKGSATKIPVAPINQAPPDHDGPPVIIPAAEQNPPTDKDSGAKK